MFQIPIDVDNMNKFWWLIWNFCSIKREEIIITTYDDETEVTRVEVVEVVDVNKPRKGKQIDMVRQMLECFLGIGCINIKAKVNEIMLNATETESFNMYIITEMLL